MSQLNEFNSSDYIIAAERDGKIVEGYKYGNSPLNYHENKSINGKKLVLTTLMEQEQLIYLKKMLMK